MSKILTNITITQVIEFLEKCLSYEIGCNSRKNVNEGIFELKEISMDLPEINLEILDIPLEFKDIKLLPIAA